MKRSADLVKVERMCVRESERERGRDRDRGLTVLQRGDGMTQTLNYSTYSQILKFKSFFASSQLLESLIFAGSFLMKSRKSKFNSAYRKEGKRRQRGKKGGKTQETQAKPL